MATLDIKPSRFFKAGTDIEARFVGDEDGNLKWYVGTVQDITYFGETSEGGSYVVCTVLYGDGEYVEDAVFYDNDFEKDNSLDNWRFVGPISQLLLYLREQNSSVEALKTELKDTKDKLRNELCDSLNKKEFKEFVKSLLAEDDHAEVAKATEDEEPNPRCTFCEVVWKMFVTMACVGLFAYAFVKTPESSQV